MVCIGRILRIHCCDRIILWGGQNELQVIFTRHLLVRGESARPLGRRLAAKPCIIRQIAYTYHISIHVVTHARDSVSSAGTYVVRSSREDTLRWGVFIGVIVVSLIHIVVLCISTHQHFFLWKYNLEFSKSSIEININYRASN